MIQSNGILIFQFRFSQNRNSEESTYILSKLHKSIHEKCEYRNLGIFQITRLDEIESSVLNEQSHSPKWRHHYFVFRNNLRSGDLPWEEMMSIKAGEPVKDVHSSFSIESSTGG